MKTKRIKIGTKIICPNCKSTKWCLVLREIDIEDEETGEIIPTKMWAVECSKCKYGNSFLESDTLLIQLEMERTYIREELHKIKKRKRYLA